MANKRTTKKAAKKEVTKAAISPVIAEEVKAETPVAAPAVEEVKAAAFVDKAPKARKNVEKKPTDNKFIIQGNNGEYTMTDVMEACKAAYRNGTRKQVKSCDVYLKAENGALRAYYVINGKAEGAFIDL